MPKPLVAVLDACVLYPAVIRDTLLLAAEAGAYQFRWTDQILSELRRNLVKDRAAPEDRGIRTDEQLIAVVERLDRALAPARTKPGTANQEELYAAWADACVVSPRMAEETAKEARRLVPLAVRVMAEGLTSSSAQRRADTANELRGWGIDPNAVDVQELADEEILALVDRGQATSQ